ncbi:M1 family metallopeptidase [Zhouia amylolytica]|uniref:Putative Zn-dependent aminopeptidase n=1 Tax=Zhouia amylolytica AD3 TaxID=1286632 RepID=W2UM89_9FLAO|nr:M1 family metallopeptidase [Zhouia amylolytica]ETN95089.1 putative Zn-dependent aminopeptidase [Zhouia amylolytica AD3]
MLKIKNCILAVIFLSASFATAQQEEAKQERKPGHINNNKFRQLYQEFATPNMFRTASGAPGPSYYQQQADYKMDLVLDDENQKLYGEETITYTNNSPDVLEYLWVQLDQNVRAQDSDTYLIESDRTSFADQPGSFVKKHFEDKFDGGFKIEAVKDSKGNPLAHTVNKTMMRIDIPKPLKQGESIDFSIKWWYNLNNHLVDRARSGYEHFEKDGNNLYIIAQFFPRMCVYSDVEGWQNNQFYGRGEFALPFGNYEVNITAPADHIMDGTGVLTNRKDLFTKEEYARWEKAQKSYDEPVVIVTQEEAEQKEKSFSKKTKTWKFEAEMVRDFAFSSSRKFIYDAMAVDINGRKVMAVSMYPKEGNPLWEKYSTKAVASTLESYSKYTFDYPYHKAISVHSKNQGMEYPMICWNYGRPDEDGSYSDRVKFGMISVIIHEVGHNFFPMIVNSDERQWTWMDEGLNTFMQYLAEQDFQKKHLPELDAYPSRRGPAKNIVRYMGGDQDFLSPIMTNSENIYQFGSNAYAKPATGLNILRETIMGPELFDHAFMTYAQRWKFKHPTPEDFFRTMEDASAMDLDWFWRGWFFTTDYVDMGVKDVKKLYVSSKPNQQMKEYIAARNMSESDLPSLVYLVEEGSEDYKNSVANNSDSENFKTLNEYIMDNFSAAERSELKNPKYFYEITFEKPGGLPMPLIAQFTYKDGSTETVKYPAMVWRKNDAEVVKVVASEKEITNIIVDPKEETADIDTSNNTWPKKETKSEFNQFKEGVKKK